MNQGNERPSYNEIKEYIRKLLGDIKEGKTDGPLESFNSLTREVFIKAYNQNLDEARRVYEIPNPKESSIAFRAAWVDVFLGCLDYYKQKIRKEGGLVFETENKVVINNNEYTFNSPLDYINRLEQISHEYDRQKLSDTMGPIVNTKSVTIGQKGYTPNIKTITSEPYQDSPIKELNAIKEAIIYKQEIEPNITKNTIEIPKEESKPKSTKLTATFPKGSYPISSTKTSHADPEYDMHKATQLKENTKETMVVPKSETKRKVRKTTDYTKYRQLEKTRGQIPLIDDELLTKIDIEDLKDAPMIFISGNASNKVETYFYDNMEILKDIPIPKAAFITGTLTSQDKVAKEAMKIIKMGKNLNSSVICYEINNDAIREIENNNKVLEAFKAVEQLAGILTKEGYKPEICIDKDVRDKLGKVLTTLEPNHIIKYPLITRCSSKELDDITENEDLLVMHSGNKYDEFMLTNQTKLYNTQNPKNYNTSSKVAWCFLHNRI